MAYYGSKDGFGTMSELDYETLLKRLFKTLKKVKKDP